MVRKYQLRVNKKGALKRGNKVIAMIAASMMAAVMLMSVGQVSANNNEDTYERFSFDGDNMVNSDWRHKRDTTSCYLNCYSSTGNDSFYVDIYGTDQHRNVGGTKCGGTYLFYEGKTMYMENYVYENYYNKAECPDGDSSAVMYYVTYPNGYVYNDFHCWWSPDNMSGWYSDHIVQQ